MITYKERLNHIKAFVFDVDGVFTDNTILLMPSGEFLRTMNTKDGYAVKLAVDKGYLVGIISGGKSEVVTKRFNDLGVKDVYLGISNKMEVFQDFLNKHDILASDCLYMGDDIPDYDVMKLVALAAAPKDAAEEIKNIAHYVSPYQGGKGCVRDIIEQTLRVQEKWFDVNVPSA
ncbi:MAG: HAD hydrolase family protein [Pseudomonadota bacterium]